MRSKLFVFITLFALPLLADKSPVVAQSFPYQDNPLQQLNDLIESTENLIGEQKTLRQDLLDFLEKRSSYLQDSNNKDLAIKAGTSAKRALEKIKEQKLNFLFEPSFISEMTLFAKLAGRPSIPSPT